MNLPPRYNVPWDKPFLELVTRDLRPGHRILDIGPGRKPSLEPHLRPPGCHWVALDISADELRLAPPGSYDSVVIADVEQPVTELLNGFDLVVSWQVLEHVRDLERVLANLHGYLRPDGRFVAMLSGEFAWFALANRVLPDRLAVAALHRLLGRPPESVFPAHYDHCNYSALQRLLSGWREADVVPLFGGGNYLSFSPLLENAYLAYENFVIRRHWRNLATHYVISASK